MSIENTCLDQKSSLSKSCEQPDERSGDGHCLMIVRTGINKNLSIEAIFEAEKVPMKGMENIVTLQF